MNFSFDTFKEALAGAEERFRKELSTVRTGQASPAILDSITVDSYGSRLPINQVATISLDGPRGLRIAVWDKGITTAIEKAVREKDLGLSVSSDDAGVRVFFPEVTEEQKEKFIRLAKEKLEEARVSVKKAREDVMGTLQKLEKDSEISEDEEFRFKAEAQKLVDATNANLNELFEKKEKEIYTV